MKLSPTDHKAIAWYSIEHKLKPRLSTPPTIYFTNSKGDEVTHQLPNIVGRFEAYKKETAKEQRAEKAAAKKRAERGNS